MNKKQKTIGQIIKREGKGIKKFKITNSWGIYDAFKLVRKNGWYDMGRTMYECDFFAIVRKVNKLLAKNIVEGIPVMFPSRMGEVRLRKFQKGVYLNKKGRLINTYPIDWKSTLELWLNDEEARTNKYLVRFESGIVYRMYYSKHTATYTNKSFYEFQPNRFMQRDLSQKIINGEIDTIW